MNPIYLSNNSKKVYAIWINRSLDIYRSMQPYMDVSKTGMLNPLKSFPLTELMSWSDTVEWYFAFYIIEINVKMLSQHNGENLEFLWLNLPPVEEDFMRKSFIIRLVEWLFAVFSCQAKGYDNIYPL